MIDTTKVAWKGISFDDAFKEWVLTEWPTTQFSQASYSETQPWQGCFIKDKKLGVIGIKSGRTGNTLTAERSIGKYLTDDNAQLLTAKEALEGASAWVSDVQARFAGWWELPDYASTAQVKRIDLCYQQRVPSSAEVFPYIHAALKAARVTLWEVLTPGRNGCNELTEPILQTHLSGVTYNQSRFEHARWYDKGIESGNEMFLNVIRHEEEIKLGQAGHLAIVTGGRFRCDRETAISRMNERYQGWGETDVYDLGKMIAEHGKTGAAAVGLVLNPEYETLYKQHLSRAIFYRVKAVAMEARKLRVPVNLRLPEDAWLNSEVL
jgi:hypothetical protein